MATKENLLDVKNLCVQFPTRRGLVDAARNVSLQIQPGEVLGLVGESGAGKSTIGNAIVNLLEKPGRIAEGSILFQGRELRGLDDDAMRKVRGDRIGMIFQDPQTSLNPLLRIGEQLIETIRKSLQLSEKQAHSRAIELLHAVGIDQPELRLKAYPHQFSGGMRQRVVIALALAGEPELIIADEPTTALDVSIQAQILDLIRNLCKTRNLGVLIVTHDIGVIANIADRVAVMYRGEVVESGPVAQIVGAPQHEYTISLIAAVPPADRKLERFNSVDYIDSDPVNPTGDGNSAQQIDINTHWLGEQSNKKSVDGKAVAVENLSLSFSLQNSLFKHKRKILQAVDNISFTIADGESFGLVGESGSGKSTVARLIVGLHKPQGGQIRVMGQEVQLHKQDKQTLESRRALQMIFQDPYSSLNGRLKVLDIVAEPIRFYKMADSEKHTRSLVNDLLDHVGLGAAAAKKYPHEFSGGQRQRISIARALASRPRILICDEPTSALDVSIQAQILNLLKDLQQELGLTMLFISHDLPVIRQMCDRVAVMRNGAICELTDTEELFNNPSHEYTRHLMNLMPRMDLINRA